jgi:cell division protein FtsL
VRRQVVLLACGLVLAGGFVAAVGQRYAAVRHGYEGETLRAERARLLAEHERLRLELSEAESPVTLEREARRIGMQPARASQIATSRRPDEQPGAAGASVAAREDSPAKRPAGVGANARVEAAANARAEAAAKRRENSPDGRERIAPRGDGRPRSVEAVKQGR